MTFVEKGKEKKKKKKVEGGVKKRKGSKCIAPERRLWSTLEPLNFFLWLESVTSSTPMKRLGGPSQRPQQLPSCDAYPMPSLFFNSVERLEWKVQVQRFCSFGKCVSSFVDISDTLEFKVKFKA